MPRVFGVSAQSPASVEQVHTAFGDAQYWLARMAAFGGSGTLASLVVGTDGVVSVATTQDIAAQLLPDFITRVVPAGLTIERIETWRPVNGRELQGEIDFVMAGGVGSGCATGSLTAGKRGSLLRFTVTVTVRLPLVGGRIESYIGNQVAEQLPEVQLFTAAWIDGHHR